MEIWFNVSNNLDSYGCTWIYMYNENDLNSMCIYIVPPMYQSPLFQKVASLSPHACPYPSFPKTWSLKYWLKLLSLQWSGWNQYSTSKICTTRLYSANCICILANDAQNIQDDHYLHIVLGVTPSLKSISFFKKISPHSKHIKLKFSKLLQPCKWCSK